MSFNVFFIKVSYSNMKYVTQFETVVKMIYNYYARCLEWYWANVGY